MKTLPTIRLLRHAQGSLGTVDYDRLSPLGFEQAERLAERARPWACSRPVRGRLRRHRETAAALGEDARVDGDLDEYRVDALLTTVQPHLPALGLDWPGDAALADPVAYLDQFLRLFPGVLAGWQEACFECEVNGPWAAFAERVGRAGDRLQEEALAQGQAVAVTSAGVISTLAAQLTGRDLAWQRQLNVELYNASVTELCHDSDCGWQVVRVNCTEHLAHPRLRSRA